MIISPDKDRTVIGNTNPKHSGGINFTAGYKGFDLGLFFNWVYGNKIYNANKIDFTSYWNRTYTNMLDIVDYEHRFKYMDMEGNLVSDQSPHTQVALITRSTAKTNLTLHTTYAAHAPPQQVACQNTQCTASHSAPSAECNDESRSFASVCNR